MGNLVFGSAERPGNSADTAEIPVVRDNDVAIGQGARPTERPEKASAAARHSNLPPILHRFRDIASQRSKIATFFYHSLV